MSVEIDNIGIIAGGGQFPMIVADAAKKQGMRVTAVAPVITGFRVDIKVCSEGGRRE